jgi:hypothetical protein
MIGFYPAAHGGEITMASAKEISGGRHTPERRKAVRYGVEFWVEEVVEAGTYFHRITSISRNGVFVAKRLPFPVGHTVDLRLGLPGLGQKVLLKGRVVGNRQDQDANWMGAGIEFLELNDAARQGLDAFLDTVPQTLTTRG